MALVAAIASTAATPVVVHVSTHVTTLEVVAAIFTAVGGLGAAVSAFFAWRAAGKSGDAARDARDALAVSLKPQVHLGVMEFHEPEGPQRPPVEARVIVTGWLGPESIRHTPAARDVRIQFNLASGKQGFASIEVLKPNPRGVIAREQPYLRCVIEQPSDDWPPLRPEADRLTITLSFSDDRGVARYERSMSIDLSRTVDGAVSYTNIVEGDDRRIS